MTARDFVYWMQGFAELNELSPDDRQWEVIKKHLNLVFVHDIDPSMPDPSGALQAAHDGKPSAATSYTRPPSGLARC